MLAEYGISILPRSVVQNELVSGKLSELNWEGSAFTALAQMVILKRKWQKPAIKELLRFVENMFLEE